MPNLFEHGYALLIGVGSCDYDKYSLPATVKDAEAIQRVLLDPNLCGYRTDNLHLLKDKAASRKRITEEMGWLKDCANNDPDATIVFFYSGHGWIDKTSGKYYLIPSSTVPGSIAKTALSAEDLTQALRDIPAERLLVILDSCHAAGMATSKEAGEDDLPVIPEEFSAASLPKGLSDELTKGKGRAVFTSSSGEQLSYVRKDGAMSIFTFHMLEALQGAGNLPGDKDVRVSNLMNYVGKNVPQTVHIECGEEQVPQFDFKTEDFAVAQLRGGKGLPLGGWEEIRKQASSAPSHTTTVTASGQGAVAIGGNANGSTIVTGSNNVVGNGNIQVGDISGSSGITIGHNSSSTTVNTGGGAYIGGSVQVQNGDFVGRDKITSTGATPQSIAEAFALLYQAVQKIPAGPEQTAVQGIVQVLEQEAAQGDNADDKKVEKWFATLAAMAPDIFEVAVDTFLNPINGLKTVFQKIAQKAREGK